MVPVSCQSVVADFPRHAYVDGRHGIHPFTHRPPRRGPPPQDHRRSRLCATTRKFCRRFLPQLTSEPSCASLHATHGSGRSTRSTLTLPGRSNPTMSRSSFNSTLHPAHLLQRGHFTCPALPQPAPPIAPRLSSFSLLKRLVRFRFSHAPSALQLTDVAWRILVPGLIGQHGRPRPPSSRHRASTTTRDRRLRSSRSETPHTRYSRSIPCAAHDIQFQFPEQMAYSTVAGSHM